MEKKLSEYLGRIADALRACDDGLLGEIARCIIDTKKTNARIFTAGNGGSAATASHFCNDLVKGCRVDDQIGFKAQALNDPMPIVTCLANDYGYDEVFTVQLQTYAQPGDLFIVFSGSGNSPNIVKAAEFAKANGLYIIGFGGRDGGKMKSLCDICFIAPTWSMEELEDLHLCYCHALVSCIREELANH
jgi:D-sedoheptulose 7-phosphate isomerase